MCEHCHEEEYNAVILNLEDRKNMRMSPRRYHHF